MLVRQFGLHPCTMCTLHAETSRLLATEEADTEVRLQDKISYVWCQEKVGWWQPVETLQSYHCPGLWRRLEWMFTM